MTLIGGQFWISFDGGAWTSLTTKLSTSLSGANNSGNCGIRDRIGCRRGNHRRDRDADSQQLGVSVLCLLFRKV